MPNCSRLLTTRAVPNLCLNLNYKKLLKCVVTINFLRLILSYKKAKTVKIPSPYLFST